MLAVALGALKTAFDTTAPWYQPTATFWVLGSTFLGSTVLLSVVLLTAVVLLRPPGLHYVIQTTTVPVKVENPSPEGGDREMEDLLKSLEKAAGFGKNPEQAIVELKETSRLKVQPVSVEPPQARQAKVRRVTMTLLGPSLGAAIFGGLALALLPGAEGFLQASFQLNTFVLLTLAYGWIGLIAYSIASVLLASSQG